MNIVQIIESKESWSNLLQQDMSMKFLYKITKYVKLLEEEMKLIDEHRKKMITEKYGEKDENSDGYIIKEESRKRFTEEFNDFLNMESELHPISFTIDELIEELQKNDDNIIKSVDLLKLEPFMKDC